MDIFTGDGSAVMDFRQADGVGRSSLIPEGPAKHLVGADQEEHLRLTRSRAPERRWNELRIEARIRVSHAPAA